jgi:ABC-type lipoprotein export system ATPase subunit
MMPLTYTASGMPDHEARKRATLVLERVGLAERMDHHPSQLSGGQQQRVAIARALVNNPPLLFADEPTGNLDTKTSKEILRMFQRLSDEDGITVVLVTHDAGVAHYAKRVIRISDGLIATGVYNGQPDGEGAAQSVVAAH